MKKVSPRDLAVDLLDRSICSVQVAAVIYDNWGIYSWGWNSSGSGFGLHAEAHAIVRSNRSRLSKSALVVAGRRRKSGNTVLSLPCFECMKIIVGAGIRSVEYRDKGGAWLRL